MEESPVVIVGAGPAGLTLGLSLAKHEIHSIILEKECEITEDPRGVYLAGDAVRILYDVGIGDQMATIGHQVESVNFHKSTFKNPPFFILRTAEDMFSQAVPDGILQIQPKLEFALRCAIERSTFCSLRCGCEVIERTEQDCHVIVTYKDNGEHLKQIKCSWMVGADGKKGVVRKRFLEPAANIIQEPGLYPYNGTWVASNLQIKLPTPITHPQFPLWNFSYTPQRVYDFFWPKGWHFCSPPGKATACGRFGPYSERFWRHEFAEPNWNSSMNSIELLWEHLIPMITRDKDENGNNFACGPVTFPKDCIEIKRCRPFTFAQKVVNKWFHNRTILIGDAAHVFPPFGGQGIACGIRDAHALSWRLAMLLQIPDVIEPIAIDILTAWALERQQGVNDATKLTEANGKLANEPETLGFYIFRNMMKLYDALPLLPPLPNPTVSAERAGYKATKGGFFHSELGGGGKIAQIYIQQPNRDPILSDNMLKRRTIMTLLIVGHDYAHEVGSVQQLVKDAKIHPTIISKDSFYFLSPISTAETVGIDQNQVQVYYPSLRKDLFNKSLRPGYDEIAYLSRFGKSAKYIILRPDFIIFSIAKDLGELELCLEFLRARTTHRDQRLQLL